MTMTEIERPAKIQPLAVGAEEARRIINMGRNQFYAMLKSGEIRAKRVGKKWLVPISELERWLAS